MTAWSRAAQIASQTPASRNRYVDLLRAVSIGAVVYGHWTAAAPYVDASGALTPTHMLAVSPWTHWLTWVIQVMPVFFIVGGFSNGISWRAARREGKPYRAWLDARLRRLVGPVLALITAWVLLGAFGWVIDLPPAMVAVGSQMALIPVWFLAVYVMVACLVPVTHAAWERFGLTSFWVLVGAAALVDVGYFAGGLHALGWINYLFVWSAVHQLGYAWRDGRFDRPAAAWTWAVGGLVCLLALIELGPYGVSMVGVPGEAISNTTPPKVILIALACLQGGFLLALQAPARRWLARPAPWTATVLVNAMIMTIFLWHMTAMVLWLGLVHALGDVGLGIQPGTGTWWATRPIWLALLTVALLPLVLLLARFERAGPAPASTPAAWRLLAGAVVVCAGLALLALDGIGGTGPLGLRLWVLVLPFAGAALMGHWHGARARAPAQLTSP